MRLAVGLLLLAACGAEELTAETQFVCTEIGRTIANLTWACGAELSAANARGRDFLSDHECTLPKDARDTLLVEVGLECPLAMAQLSCEVVRELGDDVDAWVGAVPHCASIVVAAGDGS